MVGSVALWIIFPPMVGLSLAVGIPCVIGVGLATFFRVWTGGSNTLLLTTDDVIVQHAGPISQSVRSVSRKSVRSIAYLPLPSRRVRGTYLALMGDNDEILLSLGSHTFDPQDLATRLGVPVTGSP